MTVCLPLVQGLLFNGTGLERAGAGGAEDRSAAGEPGTRMLSVLPGPRLCQGTWSPHVWHLAVHPGLLVLQFLPRHPLLRESSGIFPGPPGVPRSTLVMLACRSVNVLDILLSAGPG